MYLLFRRRPGWRSLFAPLLVISSFLALAAPALAANTTQNPVVSEGNLVLVALSLVAPLVGYVLNHYAPFIRSEQAKGVVQAVIAAGVGALYEAVGSGDFGWNNQTAVACLTAMGLALAAHVGYKTASINTLLGGGHNHDPNGPDSPSEIRTGLSA